VLRVVKPGRARIEEAPEPTMGRGEAILLPRVLGLCGTDLAIFLGTNPLVTYPRVIGHEVAAQVIAVDDPSGRIKPGDRVAVLPVFPCGHCAACRRGRTNCCVQSETPGVHREGCAAERFAMPVEKLYPAPPQMSWEELALVEPMTIGYHAVRRARVQEGDAVLIIGAGPVGLGALQAARLRGARVAACDIKDLSVGLARRLGAELAVNNARTDLGKAVREWTSGDGPVVVIEAAGAPEMMEASVEWVAQAGRVVIIGYAKEKVQYAPDVFVKKELDFLGSRNSLNVFDEVLQHVAAGRIRVQELVTHRFEFLQGVEALRFWERHTQEVCKILLTFP
jgi:threonine dehydrogenase-like Zn-dependent dehydrogenase